MYETFLAAQAADNEILIFYDTKVALKSFVKLEDPTPLHGSKIAYFGFLGDRHFITANSAGRVNIYQLNQDTVEQVFNFALVDFTVGRENLIFGTKTLNEDRIAFLTSNYSISNGTFSSIYVLQVSEDNRQLAPEKKINMELFREKGWDPCLSSINIDFYNDNFPFLMAFPRTSRHIYSIDIS